jgi:branched-chain amino acid aminotransferase
MEWICYNEDFFPADQPLFSSQHNSVKYGDGVFETVKVYKGKILLSSLHLERLTISLQLLQIDSTFFNWDKIQTQIIELCKKNLCGNCARVRVTVFRNASPDYLIEAVPLMESENKMNEEGWTIGLFPFARKSNDAYANLKSVNHQLYVLAGLYAKERNWDEALVLNAVNNLADGSKTNIFLIRGNEIFTPALHQGCVNGVMRRFLLDELKSNGYKVYQAEITEEDLLNADEVFCTNAIRGMRWVKQFKEKQFRNERSLKIYHNLLSTIYR